MKHILALSLAFGVGSQVMAGHWPLDTVDSAITVQGKVKTAPGVNGGSLVVEGASLIELNDTSALNPKGFTVSVWFNPYGLEGGQQMIVGKNRYTLHEREWGLTIEPDGKLKAHLRQDGWSEIRCEESLRAGHWHLATLTVTADKAVLSLNGKSVGEVALRKPIPSTQAPITLGGINDNGRLTQLFKGAMDEVRIEARVMTAGEIAASYKPVMATHEVPKALRSETPLWDENVKLQKVAELPLVEGARFSVIKPYEFKKDGYRFLHGVGLGFHQGKLYASFGHNRGGENTETEEARYCVSEDQGRTWSEVRTMDSGEGPVGVSHGCFLSHKGQLWAFMGAYTGTMMGIHTRAYRLDEKTGSFEKLGTVIEGGFWPMQEPIRMDDGNWIMAGISAGVYDEKGTHPAVVAISHGDDFMKWDLVVIPPASGLQMWGESTVIVEGKRITSLSRYGAEARALVAESKDFGRTWSTMLPSNLPMATSKPIAGRLSTGQRYLVCSTSADGGKRRNPLTIALSKPGETMFSRVLVIRRAVFPEGPGESHAGASLSYPYAVEHEGYLYIGYSNSGDKSTRVGEGRELWNNNSAELVVIPVERLK